MYSISLLRLSCLLFVAGRVFMLAGEGHDHEEVEEVEEGEEISDNGVFCKVLKHSGKIMCVRPPKGLRKDFSSKNSHRVIIELHELQERKRDGNSVGKAGKKGHRIDSFEKKEFEFSSLQEKRYEGLKVKTFDASTKWSGSNIVLTLITYMFLEEGNITFGNETFEVTKGMLKFNIEIANWAFCDPNVSDTECDSADQGEYIDMELVIKSKGEPKLIPEVVPSLQVENEEAKPLVRRRRCFKKGAHGKCPKQFDIGGGSEMVLNTQVMVDDVIKDMPGNGEFPKVFEEGHKQKIIFRFPKATRRILYDPGLELAEGGRGTNISAWNSACLLFVSIFVWLLVF